MDDTGHGARLSAEDASTVNLMFHGSRHAEIIVQSANASTCHLVERCMQRALAESGVKLQRMWSGTDEVAALSEAIEVLCAELNACVEYVDRKLSQCKHDDVAELDQTKGNTTLAGLRERAIKTDLKWSSITFL